MKTDELREKYLTYFASKGHRRCASDVLVPTWDPSVLFTPAGMNPFKDHFLGKVKLEFTRATSCQKCLRTGDIDNVGRTAYHHTFFEMLGNFSFGDYFKRDAIHWAWEFLTEKRWLGLDPERLSVTVYKDDDEAAEIWHEGVGLPTMRISRMEEDENFWPASAPSQGPDGVCGPCSEIYYRPDQGKEVEIWNLVFTQFNRVGDPPDNLRPLPSKNIDTGMGLERTAATLQGVSTNYHIDILRPIVEAAAEVCGIAYDPETENGRRLRRITDHVRACTFAIHENVYPGPNREKYVVRRLLRRAVLDGHQIGVREPFLCQLVPKVAEMMRQPYPELGETVERVQGVIEKEESTFFATIDGGLERIERSFDTMRRDNRVRVDGAVAADLYQTFGVPPELFESLAAERNLTFDWEGYREAMEEHGRISGGDQQVLFKTGALESLKKALHLTDFVGYEATETTAVVKGIVAGESPDDRLCDQMDEIGHEAPVRIVLDRTPFYGESGGQVGDTGTLSGDGMLFDVLDTKKDGQIVVHLGHLRKGVIREGMTVTASVDVPRRQAIRRAHSATHILHYALQKNLGSHAQQQGSKVDNDWLRFDFTNLAPVSDDQLVAIQHDIDDRIEACEAVKAEILPLADARQAGAMMLFGEKYPDPVRMVSMGTFSKELCGGTHLQNTAEVLQLEIISEEGVSAGTRRIVALTGTRAQEHAGRTKAELDTVAKLLSVSPADVPMAVGRLAATAKQLKKQLTSGAAAALPSDDTKQRARKVSNEEVTPKQLLRQAAMILNVAPFDAADRVQGMLDEVERMREHVAKLAECEALSADTLLEKGELLGGSTVVIRELPGANPNLMRQLIDQIRKKTSSSAVLFLTGEGDAKVVLVAGVSRDLVEKGMSAGNWVREVAKVVGGSGGGKPDMAQAGGKDPSKISEAVVLAKQFISDALS
ncbi:MAG: alanine--tRNA ligase [Pirellulaceae bacterium]|nr:alanine--tRNA ligase [Planctomycetales bacterium]